MENFFRTDNILLGSYLLTRKVPLVDVIENSPNHFVFLFSGEDRCFELKREFLNNGPAPARDLFSQRELLISEVKNRNRIPGALPRPLRL